MQGFEIDHKAFRAQNVGRPPEHLIREAIQNAFDEAGSQITVSIRVDGRYVELIVQDDGPGFKDEKEIWTIFASGKRDDATKRGRLGRGLKELISVAAFATIETAGKRIRFTWTGKTMERKVGRMKRATGTRVHALIPSWPKSQAAIDQIVSYLRTFIPPEGKTMFVNGEPCLRLQCEHELPSVCLETVKFDESGAPERSWRHTTIRLLRTVGDRWIYEMGIPVEKIPDEDGFAWSIDIGQRTPLRPERDMLPRSYVHSLYAHVANAMMDRLPTHEMSALWMEEAVGNHNFDKADKGKVYVEKRFGANAARAIVGDCHDRNEKAIQDGRNVIQTNHVSAAIRDVIRQHVPSIADLYPVAVAEARYIPEADWTPGERQFVGFSLWLASQLNLPRPSITILDSPRATCEADSGQSATVIRINRSGVPAGFFTRPRIANWLPLIVHELAHRTGDGHNPVFWREVENMSGAAAEVIHLSPTDVNRFLDLPAEPAVPVVQTDDVSSLL